MKVKRKEQDIYTPLSWCDRMNSAYQMSIRNGVSAEAIMDILTGQQQTYPLILKVCGIVFHEGTVTTVLNAVRMA